MAKEDAPSKMPTTIEPEVTRKRTRCQRNRRDGDDKNNSNSCAVRCFPFLESERYRNKYRPRVLLVLAFVVVSLAPGLIYGWPALRSRLITEQQSDNSTASLTEEQLALMYTAGAWSTQGGRFFMGLLRDRFGTSAVACASLLALLAGLLGVGASASDPENNVAALTISLFCVGLGSGAQLCVQPVAGLFPDRAGIVLAGLSGAFQVSGLVFLVLTGTQNSLLLSFGIFGACIFVLLLVSAILLPRGVVFALPEKDESISLSVGETKDKGEAPSHDDRYVDMERQTISIDKGSVDGNQQIISTPTSPSNGCKNPASKQDEETAEVGVVVDQQSVATGKDKTEDDTIEHVAANNKNDQITAITHRTVVTPTQVQLEQQPPTAWQQIKTAEYLLLVGWFCIGIIPMQYYVGILGYQFEDLGDVDGQYQELFSYIYAGAAVTAPLAGHIADQRGLGVAQGLATLIMAIPFCLLAARNRVPLRLQVVGLVAYGIGRMGIFGLYFANCGKRFGYANYGALAGSGLIITAIVSLLQYPLITLTVRGHATPVNSFLAVVLLLQAPYFLWLRKREQRSAMAII